MSSTIAKLGVPPVQKSNSLSSRIDVVVPTPTVNSSPQKRADFTTLVESLEYAAQGETGYNFYDSRGNLKSVLAYKDLCANSKIIARRLSGLGLARNSRFLMPILLRSSSSCFACRFCRPCSICWYQILASCNLCTATESMLESSKASVAVANLDFVEFLNEAVGSLVSSELKWGGHT